MFIRQSFFFIVQNEQIVFEKDKNAHIFYRDDF